MFSALLFQAANAMMGMMSGNPLLGDETVNVNDKEGQWGWVGEVVDAINLILYPILVLVGTAGVIYAVVLGVKLARAESADQQQEAKKRMINFIIGLVSIIALILLLKLFCTYLPQWIPEINVADSPTTGN